MWSSTASPGRQGRIVGFTAGLLVALFAATAVVAREPSVWDGMAEGAALKLGTAARQLGRTAADIAGDGRVGRLSLLRSDADDLVRRADALARMSREPLPEEAGR